MDIYEPVMLMKLRTVKVVESPEEWVTAIDMHSGDGLYVGYRSGKARFFDLEKAKSILEFGAD